MKFNKLDIEYIITDFLTNNNLIDGIDAVKLARELSNKIYNIDIQSKESKKHYYCLRCGIQKIKGYWEAGCKAYGRYYEKHMWSLADEDGKITV